MKGIVKLGYDWSEPQLGNRRPAVYSHNDLYLKIHRRVCDKWNEREKSEEIKNIIEIKSNLWD